MIEGILSFKEFYAAYDGDPHHAWQEYVAYGGLPAVRGKRRPEEKAALLRDLWDTVYLEGILKQNRMLHGKDVLGAVVDAVCASTGFLTTPRKIAKAVKDAGAADAGQKDVDQKDAGEMKVSHVTVGRYIDFLLDATLIRRAGRYDVKGRKEVGPPVKYYAADVGLLNARFLDVGRIDKRLSFQRPDMRRAMETILYNELCRRGFAVHVGILDYSYKDENKKSKRKRMTIDFVADKGSTKYYIQLMCAAEGEDAYRRVSWPLRQIRDSFRKIVVVQEDVVPWNDAYGILYVGIERFLIEENIMNM